MNSDNEAKIVELRTYLSKTCYVFMFWDYSIFNEMRGKEKVQENCNKTWLKTLSTAALFAVSFLVKNAFSFFSFSVVSSAERGAEL